MSYAPISHRVERLTRPWFAAAAMILTAAVPSLADSSPVATPTVTGPITGGTHGSPFAAALMDLSKVGYVEEEYFLEGNAVTFAPAAGTQLEPDGRWSVTPGAPQAYKTRILVRRPKDSKRFSGTVVVEWMQASAGFDKDVNWNWQHAQIIRDGYVWVGVSPQHESVDGTPPSPKFAFVDLVHWDAARYGTLHIPSDDLSYDIFSQVGRIVGPSRPKQPVDPLNGLKVTKVLPIGDTFAADRLTTYYNAVQPLARVFDGFFMGSRHISSAAPLSAATHMPDIVRIRTDLSAPVIVSNTMAEAPYHYPARQPDAANYRLWEIAGGAHTNAFWAPQMYAIIARDLGTPAPVCDRPFDALPNQYVMNAALWQLNRWVRGGPPAPSFPPLAISGTPPALDHDSFGNAAGGIRLPEITVPIARYEAGGDRKCAAGSGFTIALPPEQLASLYPTHEAYVAKFTEAAKVAEKAGFLLPGDAAEAIRAAKQAPVPR